MYIFFLYLLHFPAFPLLKTFKRSEAIHISETPSNPPFLCHSFWRRYSSKCPSTPLSPLFYLSVLYHCSAIVHLIMRMNKIKPNSYSFHPGPLGLGILSWYLAQQCTSSSQRDIHISTYIARHPYSVRGLSLKNHKKNDTYRHLQIENNYFLTRK